MKIQSTVLISLSVLIAGIPAFAARASHDTGEVSSNKPDFERQDTGLSDPSVNPGQASGTRTVHGLVLRLQDQGYVIRDSKGHEVSILVDGETTGDTELSPGDYVETKLTREGRAITMTKESSSGESQEKRGSSTK